MLTWLKVLWCNNRHIWYTITMTLRGGKRDGWTREYQICWDCGRVFRDGVEVYRPKL